MVRWHRRILAVGFVLGSSALPAQYTRVIGDTIRIRELSLSTMSATTPNGVVNVRTEHDAQIAVEFGPADAAQAWYESLRLSVVAPQGKQEPATSGALRLPFLLRFDARGRIETLRTPTFPSSVEGVSDLSHQFDDLFLRLPAGPLALGVSWTDTAVTNSRPAANERWRSARYIASRVVRDTVVAGEAAWIIESTQRHAIESSKPVEGQPMTVRTQLAGADSGVFVFSQHQGRLLGRQRTGSLTGTLTYEGGPQPIVIPVRQSYTNTVTRVP